MLRGMGRGEISTTALWGEVNLHILGAASDLAAEEGLEWEFLCECSQADCEERVELTLEAYAGLREAGGIVLAPGHGLSAIERARRLSEDAEALCRQAEHQVARAKKNLRLVQTEQ